MQSGVWDADTVWVTDQVFVKDSLCITAGTTVVFNGFYSIKVERGASLNALGAEGDSITFTVADTTGFHIFDAGRGGWNGIRLEKAGPCRFDHCRFQYGKAALDSDQDGGAFRIFHSNEVKISNSTLFCNFSREHGGALNAEHSKVIMHDCDVKNNQTYTGVDTVYFMYGGGLRFINCDVELVDMAFRHNNGHSAIGGALSLDSCSVNIDRCVFEHNHGVNGGGLYIIRCYDNPGRIANSLFANNVSEHFGGGLAISDSSPEVSNITVTGNLSIGVNCGGIFFYQCSSPVVRNCIIYGNFNSSPLEEPVQMWAWTYDDYAPMFYNCLVQFGHDNIENHENILVYEDCMDADPLFADPDDENYRLGASSPCLNAGLTKEADLTAFDLDKSWRVCGSEIDLGAYEYTATGVDEISLNEPAIRIAGNPISANSFAEIELDGGCNLSARIYSVDGKLLVNKDLGITHRGNNRFGIGEMFSMLPSGAYVLAFTVANKTFVTKVVK